MAKIEKSLGYSRNYRYRPVVGPLSKKMEPNSLQSVLAEFEFHSILNSAKIVNKKVNKVNKKEGELSARDKETSCAGSSHSGHVTAPELPISRVR